VKKQTESCNRKTNSGRLCLKNDTALACCNLDEHRTIVIILGRNVATNASNKMVCYFPTSPNWCFCTTWGNRKPKIASFYLNAECCFANRHTKHVTWSQLNHPSLAELADESTVFTKQNLGGSIACYCLSPHTVKTLNDFFLRTPTVRILPPLVDGFQSLQLALANCTITHIGLFSLR